MKYIFFAIVVIILWWLKKLYFAKLDRDEEKAARTPGEATYIREHFPNVIQFILSKPGYHIIFERTDMIKMGQSDSEEYYMISQYSGGLLITLVRKSNVVQEWSFSREEDEKHIIYKLQSNF